MTVLTRRRAAQNHRRDLAVLENETAKSMHQAVRNSARRVLRVLVTRYDINLHR